MRGSARTTQASALHALSFLGDRRVVAFLLGVLIPPLLGTAIATGHALWLALIALGAGLALAVIFNNRFIVLVISLCFLGDYIIYLAGLPGVFIYITYGAILLFVGVVLTGAVLNQRSVRVPRLMLLWMAFLLGEFLLNGSRGALAAQRLISYLLYPLLFLAVLNMDAGRSSETRIAKSLVFYVALQVPFTIVQRAVMWGVHPDFIGGTLGRAATNFMAVLMAGAWCFALAHFLTSEERRRRQYLLLLLPFVPPLLGNGNAMFLLTTGGAVAVYVAYLYASRQSLSKKLPFLALLAIPLALGYWMLNYVLPIVQPNFDSESWQYMSSVDDIVAYSTGYDQSGVGAAYRLEQITLALDITSDPFFGSGLDAANSSGLLESDAGALAAYRGELEWATAFTKTYLEIGLVGLGLTIFLMGSFGLRGIRLARYSSSWTMRALGLGMAGAVPVFVASSLYCDAWRANATAAAFWVCAALTVRFADNLGVRNDQPELMNG